MAEPDKRGNGAEPGKGYSLSVFLFVVGIVAVGLTILFSGFSKMPKTMLVSEILVLFCLIGLLVVSIVAKKRTEKQLEQQERYPYTNVDKKSIENIFDIIADEEKKRRRLDAFAAGVDFQATQPARAQAAPAPSEEPEKKSAPDAPPKPASDSETGGEGDEDKPVIAVLDAEEDSEPAGSPEKPAKDGEGSEVKDNGDDRPREKAEPADRERQDAERQGAPAPGRRAPGGDPRQKKRRPPYDPYYEERYDQYGRPIRRRPPEPIYYDEYGRPIRRRAPEPIYYDEYGNPIRRRPQRDPYAAQQGQRPKKRRPEGAAPPADGKKRAPAESAAASGEAAGGNAAAVRSGPVAPVEMTPKLQQSRYSDEYIPVAIRDDEYIPAQKPTRVPRKDSKPKPAPRAAAHYEDEVDRSAPIVIPDDDYNPGYDDDVYEAPRHAAAAPQQRPQQRPQPREEYRPVYDEEEVVVVHTFDEEGNDEPSYHEQHRGYQGRPQQSHARTGAHAPAPNHAHAPADTGPYVPDYEDEDVVTVLPRDDGYDTYMEQKRSQERKAERRSKGKTALTIQKMRRRKIRRKSRKYKRFRCSVHTLTNYLNSFSMRTGR